jgi:hypothetical protein
MSCVTLHPVASKGVAKSRALTIVAATFVVACSGKSAVERSMERPATTEPTVVSGTIMETEDGRRFFGHDSAIDVRRISGKETVDVSVTVGSGRDLWTSLFRITRPELPRGGGVATIKQVPMEVGIGWAERLQDGRSTVRAASGTIAYELAEGRMKVVVTSDSSATSGTIHGAYQIRCWVEPSELGLPSQLGTSNDGLGEIVVDRDFETEFCRPLAP